MQDLLLVAAVLGSSTLIGYPICLLFPEERFVARFVAAPTVGFAALCAATIVAYKLGVTPRLALVVLTTCGLLASVAHLIHAGRRSLPPMTRWGGVGLTTLAVVLLCLLPAWIGGPQFAVFQGNLHDHLNVYLPGGVAFHQYDYATVISAERGSFDFPGAAAARYSLFRPISVVLSAFAGVGHPTIVGSGYAFMVALQVNILFSALFVALNIFAASKHTASLVAAALTVGFFQQYVIDINAMAQLSVQSLYLFIIAVIVLAFDGGRFGNRPAEACVRLTVLFGVLMTAALLLYPDPCAVYGPAGAVAAALALLNARSRPTVLPALAGIGIGTAVALLASYWFGSLTFFFTQMTAQALRDLNWWKYFQRYLFGRETNYLDVLAGDSTWPAFINALFSLPAEAAMATIGLYWFLPSSSWPLPLAIAVKLVLYAFIFLLFSSAIRTAAAAWRNDPAGCKSRMLAACIAGCMIPLLFLVMARYWTAGKALSIASPLLFFLLAAPIFSSARLRWSGRAACTLFVVEHLLTGAVRPVMAADRSGAAYTGLPRTETMTQPVKPGVDWRADDWAAEWRHCKAIILDIDNSVLSRVAQLVATDIGRPWASTPATTMGAYPSPVFQPPGWEQADCLATDRLSEFRSGRRMTLLVRDRAVFDFLAASSGTLEIGVEAHYGVAVEGRRNIEKNSLGPLRWMTGEARFAIANSTAAPATELVADVLPQSVPPGARVQITVNDEVAYEGPAAVSPIRVPLRRFADQTSLTVAVKTMPGARGDTGNQERGVALRSLRLEKSPP